MMKRFLLFFLCAVSSQMLVAQTVGPLIQTQWDQGDPYNMLLPEKDGMHCLTSCGATAEAQIIYYHRWPEHGMGLGYYHLVDEDLVYVDLTKDYYDYDKMLLTYDANSSAEAKQAVALLMRDVAFTGATLDTGESGSPTPGSLITMMGYDKGMMHLYRGYCTMEDFKSIIRSELDAGRPVLLEGSNGSVGHAFVCDGYRDNDEFHFNYGWSGRYDGWSTLENCLFPVNMAITYNIKKDEGGLPGFTFSSNRDFKWFGGNTLSGNYKFESYSKHELMPQIALAVENTATHEVQYFCHFDKEPGDPHDNELTWELDEALPDGSYILYPVAHGKDLNTEWQKAYFRDQCQREVVLTVKDGVKTFANATLIDPVREGAVEVDGLCYELDAAAGTATFTYRNDKYASYFGDIVIPETITYDGKTYKVTAIGREAFRECKNLGHVTFGKNVTIVGWGAFDQAKAGDVTFAEGSQLSQIDPYAFYSATFRNVILPEGLKTIGSCAFANSSFQCITIPTTVTSWQFACFQTTSLVSVRVNATTPQVVPDVFRHNVDDADFADYNDWMSYGTEATVLYVPAGTKDAYAKADVWNRFGFILEPGDDDSFIASLTRDAVEIDGIAYQVNGVKGIANAARVKAGVKNVIVKNALTLGGRTLDVKSIGNAFLDPGGAFDKIVIAASVEKIGWDAIRGTIGSLEFEAGSQLKEIKENGLCGIILQSPLVLPEGLESIGSMWISCPDVTIPSTVKKMGSENGLNNLKDCRVSWPTPYVTDNLFAASVDFSNATLHVPEGTKALYAAAEGWSRFGTIVEDGGKLAIRDISIPDSQFSTDGWFTLDGRRLDGQPTRKGLYIHQGKKIVVK